MHLSRTILGALLTAAMALSAVVTNTAPAAAQNYNSYNYGNPGVANVSVANGNVVIVRGDSGQQVPATVNAPLVPGDVIATGSGSLAEVQFDGISMLRLAGNTQVRFVNLSPGSREMQLAAGTVDLAELQGADGSPQLDTPSLSVRPNQTGDYRVSVLGNVQTLVTVRNGAATVMTANGSRTLTPGSTLVAYGSSINMQNAIGFDSFDQFNISRDQAVVSSYNANPYLSPQLAGYSNFANYGQWQNVPGYGYAWAPNNQSQTNFAPYQNGQWTWEPGYGYTWVDNAPYGYATSHYGTWFNNQNYGGWLWQPPGYQQQNSAMGLASSWLPAVVSFFLTGGNGGLGGGLGNILGNLTGFLGNSNAQIGWVPLAPGEQYQPWYGQNYSYPTTSLTNVPNVTNIYNYYSNARYYGGVKMVPVSAFRSGNFKRVILPRPQQIKQIVLIRGAVPVVPTTANLHYSSRAAVVKHPIVLSRTFAAPRLAAKAPSISRISFKRQQTEIRSIATVRPKVVPLSARPAPVAHPVYQPTVRAPIHPAIMKPVTHPAAPVAKPATRPIAPVVKPMHTAAPVVKPMRTPAPIVRPMPVHTAAPVVRPMRTPAPIVRPMPVHTAAPVVRPMRTPAPIVRPMPVHTAAPVIHPMRTQPPMVRPESRPPSSVTKPMAHPETKPATRATAKPAPKATTTPHP